MTIATLKKKIDKDREKEREKMRERKRDREKEREKKREKKRERKIEREEERKKERKNINIIRCRKKSIGTKGKYAKEAKSLIMEKHPIGRSTVGPGSQNSKYI